MLQHLFPKCQNVLPRDTKKLTWNKEDENEVYMVRQPADHEQDDHYEAHLHDLPLLLHRPSDGWLPGRVVLHAQHKVPATP